MQGFGLVDLGAVLPLADPASPNGMRNGSHVSPELCYKPSIPYRRRRIGRHCNRSDRPHALWLGRPPRGQPCRTDQHQLTESRWLRIVKGFRLNVTDSTVPLGTNQVYETSLLPESLARCACPMQALLFSHPC